MPVLDHLPPAQTRPPKNHATAELFHILERNLRKEQDLGRCLVLSMDALKLFPEIRCYPLGVVPKPGHDISTHGRMIHDLSYPKNRGISLNDCTNKTFLPTPSYDHCRMVAQHILHLRSRFPNQTIRIMAGDVAGAFRHVSLNENVAFLFGSTIPELDVVVVDLACPFGWTASPAAYDIFGSAISYVHNNRSPIALRAGEKYFAYYWVDDHINVSTTEPDVLTETELSLRHSILEVLGPTGINEDKFTAWESRLKVLGLIFDCEEFTVSMPTDKVHKARLLLQETLQCTTITLTRLRQLLGVLRHVKSCIRPASAFMQRLSNHSRAAERSGKALPISAEFHEDIQWWLSILNTVPLNGIPLCFFNQSSVPDIEILMDACDQGLCVAFPAKRRFLLLEFNAAELSLIQEFKRNHSNEFCINYREMLSTVYAILTWGKDWAEFTADRLTHVRFRIDNTSAVSWTNRMHTRHSRAQTLVRVLTYYEAVYNLRVDATHIAGVDNILADAGSRSFTSLQHKSIFTNLTSHWQQDFISPRWRNVKEGWHSICASNPSHQLPVKPMASTSTIGSSSAQAMDSKPSLTARSRPLVPSPTS